jgi:(p)ppGpp synthase/HD superfamily hydrolase
MLEPSNTYNLTHLTYEELEARLVAHCEPIDVTRVLDAYEMARNVHEFQRRNDGTPYFFHASRTVKILMDELHVYDSDILIASLLQDVLEDSDAISRTVLDYNFGSYVAYVVEMLTKDLKRARSQPEEVDLEHVEKLKTASADCVLIKLVSRLDNIRCLSFNLKRNPLQYLYTTFERYVPIADASDDLRLYKVAAMIRAESNRFLG